ncbi:hypothetical protein ACRB68_31960 [Actinomadura sp. RB68]|uniref:Metal-dependent hydrolase n=1 Tax=Actinomadura macrotermitis TaxID=2585200 RepID=A0A7K0BVC9_9ACTN|nr:hypothetical protein [Actinomadura macrotermitis]
MTFPAGGTAGESRVIMSVPLDGGHGVVVEETPFHPLDPSWPDQPADTGVLGADGLETRVVDCLTGAMRGGELLVGADIPVRRGDPDWSWLVVHVVERDVPVGVTVRLAVDEERRRALSAGHTACHLMALALNEALAPRWRKEVRPDGLGHPDFDALAIASSRIVPGGSLDTYRIGTSLRKKGFTAEGLAGDLPKLAEVVEARMARWIAADAPVAIEAPGPGLTAPRRWRCALPEGTVEIPCGGTHLSRLGELGAVRVSMEPGDAGPVVRTEVS